MFTIKTFKKIVQFLTSVNKIIAFTSVVLMMLLVTLFAFLRIIGYPAVGGIEYIQFLMVVLIASSLAFTEKDNAHIKIGLIVDTLSANKQKIFDLIGYSFLVLFCFLIVWVTIININFDTAAVLTRTPYFPFKILIIIGFFAWGLEGIRKFLNVITSFSTVNKKE